MKQPGEKPTSGLCCPDCGCAMLQVVYTRHRANHIFRLRECRYCGRRVRTRERIQEIDLGHGCGNADSFGSGTSRANP